MSVFTKYNTLTGEVICTQTTRFVVPLDDLGQNEDYVPGLYPSDDYYIDNAIAVARPNNPASADKAQLIADGVDAVTITAIPDASRVTITGPGVSELLHEAYIPDDPLIVTVDTPGSYVVYITSFPERDGEIHFAAT